MAKVPDKPAQRTKFFATGDKFKPEIMDFVDTIGGGGGGGTGGSGLILRRENGIFYL